MDKLSEISEDNKLQNIEYNKWLEQLSHMDDMSVSRELYNRIMNHSDLDAEDKKLLKDSYEYCIKLIRQGKSLEPDLLKIYLKDLLGYDINQVNMVNLIVLLGCCGIVFNK